MLVTGKKQTRVMTAIPVDKWQVPTFAKSKKELPEMNSGGTTGKVTVRARVQKYRATHRRVDYAPAPRALAAIERHLAAGLDNCIAGVIDRLIDAGDRAVTGNGQQ